MTASWGGMGILWNKPVVFVFIRPQRFTNSLVSMSYNDSIEDINDEKEVPMNKKLTMRDIAEYFTNSLVSEASHFSLSFYPEHMRDMLTYMGTVRGKDEDKITKAGLHVVQDWMTSEAQYAL